MSRTDEAEFFGREFGGYGKSSEIYLAPSERHFIDKSFRRRCILTALGQRGWSVDVTIKMVYIKGGVKDKQEKSVEFQRISPTSSSQQEGELEFNPEKVVMRLEPSDYPAALKASQALSSTELLQRYSKLRFEGIEDPTCYYNTKRLASFPDNVSITLPDRQIKTTKVRIAIPGDLPEELIGQRLTVELKSIQEHSHVPVQENKLYVIAVS
ncbi:hypothetical protein [Nitrososphaera viennensis]|nr:hypothetical protein [Nitrososphaera viennensis]UVS68825.1 hypothetical protein NWT39_13070 [Nitrososphaera viennensis]